MITLPTLPYAYDALGPVISERTLTVHHKKHHAAYVNKTNELIEGTPFADKDLETIVRETCGKAEHKKLFNQAAQAWNHGFYWRSLTPGGGQPDEAFGGLMSDGFGGWAGLRDALVEAATNHFASGWAWLTLEGGKLEVRDTHDAVPPFCEGDAVPLLCIDVWEHAYYLDYQNVRADHVEAVVDRLLNWDFASANLRAAPR
jgi:Fe-Mn family superoxide dismutase